MSTTLPLIANNKSQKVQYNYKSLDKSMSLKRNTPMARSQALKRNIDRYYQSSDAHDILGHEKNTYPSALQDSIAYDQNMEISGNLKQLRKTYDMFRTKTLQREKEILKMRKEIDQMKVQRDGFTGNKDYYLQKLEDLKNKQTEIGNQLQDAKMNKKSYEYMIERMKKDLICFKLRAHTTQDELEKGKIVLKSAQERFQKTKQKYNKIETALNKVLDFQKDQEYEREKNIESFKKTIQEKKDMERQKEARIKRQIEIAEIAANDLREGNLKKWRKLLLVHNFLNIFLKRKMEREMKKFLGVEQAFQKIKAATGISEAGEIVHKFLNREHTYSHLLISIADYEQKIEELRKKNESYKNQIYKLKQNIQPLEKVDTNKMNNKHEQILQEYSRVQDKYDQSILVKSRLREWISRNLLRVQRAVGQEPESQVSTNNNNSGTNIVENFKMLKQLLEENLLKVDKQELNEAISYNIRKDNLKGQNSSQMQFRSEASQYNNNMMNNSNQKLITNNSNMIPEENGKVDFQKRNVRALPPSHRLDTSQDSIKDIGQFSEDQTSIKSGNDIDVDKEEAEFLSQKRQALKYKSQEPTSNNKR